MPGPEWQVSSSPSVEAEAASSLPDLSSFSSADFFFPPSESPPNRPASLDLSSETISPSSPPADAAALPSVSASPPAEPAASVKARPTTRGFLVATAVAAALRTAAAEKAYFVPRRVAEAEAETVAATDDDVVVA